MQLEVGKTYGQGKLARTIVKIEKNNIYYVTSFTKAPRVCFITTFEDWVVKQNKQRCDYCNVSTQEHHLQGADGVVYDAKNDSWYLFAEHFRNEKVRINGMKYCPKCGRKLHTVT